MIRKLVISTRMTPAMTHLQSRNSPAKIRFISGPRFIAQFTKLYYYNLGNLKIGWIKILLPPFFPPVAVSPSPLALSTHNPESGDNGGSSRRGGHPRPPPRWRATPPRQPPLPRGACQKKMVFGLRFSVNI